jgi:glycerophosphoryl diester phosphodiesterase
VRRKFKITTILAALAAGAVYVANASWLAPAPAGDMQAFAHRGVHHTFPGEGLTNDTCTANRIYTPKHSFIENTIASIGAAFEAGADVVEFDVHPTTDGEFAVFHDWTLECRTNGKGVTREQPMTALRALDIGYGYTADGGRTYPFRGQGIGLMPTMGEVLATFPDRRFFIHVKSRDASEGQLLATHLGRLSAEARARLIVYGHDVPLDTLKGALPDQRVISRRNLMNCLLRYIALGWSGHVPKACRGQAMFVPINIAQWLWGWPNRLAARLQAADTLLVVLGPYSGGEFTSGVDTEAMLRALPANFPAAVWTNEIRTIGPLLKHGQD